jgi:hypothetical protein
VTRVTLDLKESLVLPVRVAFRESKERRDPRVKTVQWGQLVLLETLDPRDRRVTLDLLASPGWMVSLDLLVKLASLDHRVILAPLV